MDIHEGAGGRMSERRKARKPVRQLRTGDLPLPDAPPAKRQEVHREFVSDESLCIRPSTVEGGGMGLFAARDIPAGSLMGPYRGQITLESTFNRDVPPELRARINRYAFSTTNVKNPGVYVLDPTWGTGMWSPEPSPGRRNMVAAANEPPFGTRANVRARWVSNEGGLDPYQDPNVLCIFFEACHEIRAGSEIFVRYGEVYDRQGYTVGDDCEA